MLRFAAAEERQLIELEHTSMLPENPDKKRVEQWMLDAYRHRWAG